MSVGIKDMRAFCAIVEEGNISHAAQRLDAAQPALSRQIKRIEEELGVKLFDRGARNIRLTAAGRVFYNRVEKILGMIDGTIRELNDIGKGSGGSIRIGTITTSGAMILPELINQFHAIYPDITFEIWESEGARILDMLDNRRIEIAVTRTAVDGENYDSLVLPHEPFVMLMNAKNDCGASPNEVRVAELEGQPLIIPLRWKSIFVSSCRERGFEPKIFCVSDSFMQGYLMVKMGLGMAMLPMSSQTLMTDGELLCKRLVDPEMTTHTVVCWLKDQTLSTACRNFLKLFEQLFVDGRLDAY